MAGLGDYSKKGKGNRGYKMKGPSLLKMVSALKNKDGKHILEKNKVGPVATKKPIDWDKFEEYTRVMQGMENVEQELFSDEMTHDIVKKNLRKKKKNTPVKPKSGDMEKYSDLEKYDDDRN